MPRLRASAFPLERMIYLLLMQGDCLEKMKEIPDGSVDMVLCDLPYGTTRNQWDAVIPFQPLWEQYHRVCKNNAAILLFGQMPFSADVVMSNPHEFRYEWIYKKTNPTGFLNAKKMPLKYHEQILVFYRRAPTYNPQFGPGAMYRKKDDRIRYSENYGMQLHIPSRDYSQGRRYPADVIEFSSPSYGKDRGLHPTQKPVALLEYLIRTYTNEGDTVLDNTMGSGSTGAACVKTKRDFVGIEIDKSYYQIASERIAEEKEKPNQKEFSDDGLQQTSLFDTDA